MAANIPRRAKQLLTKIRTRIRKNDTVRIIAGRDKGKTGRVLEVNRSTGRLLVEGVMLIKRHVKPNPARGIKGGIAEREGPIHISNVMLLTSEGTPTRVGVKIETTGGRARRVRVARKGGETLDKK